MEVSGVVIDRFTREQQLASYPLAQYGPGVASYNVDGKSYQWQTLLPELHEFFRDVCSAHEEPLLKDRLESISVRAVDFYRLDQEQINDFLSSRLQVRVASPLDSMPQLVGAKVVPTYRSSWSIDVHSKFEFSAEMGQANGKLGLVVQFHYESKGSHVESTGFETWLAHAHAVTGDAFFKMLSPKLKEELNGTSLY